MRTLFLTLITCLFVLPAQAKYSGGSGEPNDPYQIATAADLIALGETPADYDKHFLLTADIDLDPNLPGRKVFDRAIIAPARITPGGVYGNLFNGVFDGNGHTISHLTMEGGFYLGLFGQLESGAEVRSLGVVEVDITGSGSHVGGVAGSGGRIVNCYVSGSLSGKSHVGGLVGAGNATRCHSTAAVSGADLVGGLVGLAGTVIRCYSTGTVNGGSQVGGLVGLTSGTVIWCYSAGMVNGGSQVGGLVGYGYGGYVAQCHSSVAVSGTGSSIGGLVGENNGSLSQCYSTGAVSGEHQVGGLVGINSNLSGGNAGTVAHCFWNTQMSGQATSAGGTGKTTGEMQDIQTYLAAGWDWIGETANGTSEIWQIPPIDGYPVLTAFNGYTPPQLQGAGTPDDPYLISNAQELGAMVHYSPHACYRLAASVDLSGIRWSVPVVPWFAGIFDGNDRTISDLTIEAGGDLGLFGVLESGAQVRDLGVVDVNITGWGPKVGAVAGVNVGNLTRCHSTGTVRGSQQIGGVVGFSGGGGALTRCYSESVVSGGWAVGGLVGHNYGTVTQCYSTGAVSGKERVGGLVGYHEYGSIATSYSTGSASGTIYVGGLLGSIAWGHLSQCYSTGAVVGTSPWLVGGLVGEMLYTGATTPSFWDVQTSGQTTSAGGTGKTTAEMQTAKTFLDAGWDFVGETPNGTEGIWKIAEGLGYPRLAWEKYSGGTGEPNDPYQIATAADLIALGETPEDYDRHFILTADIDLDPNLPGRKVFDRAVIAPDTDSGKSDFQGTPFTGVFDGSSHTISHLTAKGKDYLGLFGYLEAEVMDMGVVGVNVISLGSFVGGLVAYKDEGIVTRCYSIGAVSGNWGVGGLVGGNYMGIIATSYSTGVVSGNAYAGGLVGENQVGHITDCYSTSAVSGNNFIGGLVGGNMVGHVTRCYSIGVVRGSFHTGGLVADDFHGTVTASFWDTQTSGQTTSAGGTGKTTVEMQTAKTFLDANWDFVGETANGTEDIWWILEGKDYPRLWWEQ